MSVDTSEQDAVLSENAQDTGEKIDSTPEQAVDDGVEIESLLAPIEAMLVSSDRPLKSAAICDALGVHVGTSVGEASVIKAIDLLNTHYREQGRAFNIEQVSGGFRMMTLPEHAPVIAAMHRSRATTRLSKPALETLAIIAYRQPITRAELESIRGVACGEVVRSLMDRRLVKITGRAEELGRPMLYGTTRQFLDTFGLASLKDLPKPEDFADQLNLQGA
jgi:segregation and condensation protein B